MNRICPSRWPSYAPARLGSRIFRNPSTIRHTLLRLTSAMSLESAIKYAVHLAQRFQAKLTLLHICELPAVAGTGSNRPDDENSKQKWDRAKLSLLSLYDIVRAQYTNVEPCLRRGEPGEEVILAARSLLVDLIIVSRHDYAWLRHSADQGESKRAFRDVPCPVLIVQEGARDSMTRQEKDENLRRENPRDHGEWINGRVCDQRLFRGSESSREG